MSERFHFSEVTAVESLDARDEVVGFAVELQADDLRSWERSCAEADRLGRPRPQKSRLAFDLEHCRAESRRIRLKRERDATYFNDLTNPTP